MSDTLVDVRTLLAASENVRVEVGRDGALHIVTAVMTLHLQACARWAGSPVSRP